MNGYGEIKRLNKVSQEAKDFFKKFNHSHKYSFKESEKEIINELVSVGLLEFIDENNVRYQTLYMW